MTSSKKYRLTCNCGEKFEAPLYDSINVEKDPALKDEVLERKVNVVMCPKCGKSSLVEKLLLYHDPSSKLMVHVFPRSYRDKEAVVRAELERAINERIENGELLGQAPQIPLYIRQPQIVFSLAELAVKIRESDEQIKNEASKGSKEQAKQTKKE